MRRISVFLIRLLGPRRYLAIPHRIRRRLWMVCGEDLSRVNATLLRILRAARPGHN